MPDLLKQISAYFNLNRTERRGLIVLLSLLLVIISANLALPLLVSEKVYDYSHFEAELAAFLKEQNQLEKSYTNKAKTTGADSARQSQLFYFDPNQLGNEQWIALGLSPQQIQVIKNYEAKGGRFKQPSDLAKIYSIDEVTYNRLEPWIRIKTKTEIRTEEKEPLNLHSFDPNIVSADELISMGLPERIASNIINYRKSGGKYQVPIDLKKLYTINDSLFTLVEPFVDIMVAHAIDTTTVDSSIIVHPNTFLAIPINLADTLDLQQIKGVGPSFSRRIIKYRDLLGGYIRKEQLLEVYGMDSSRYLSIIEQIEIENNQVRKININSAGVKDLIKHPYIEFYLAKSIITHREEIGNYKNLEEMLNAKLIYEELFEKIKPYLTI